MAAAAAVVALGLLVVLVAGGDETAPEAAIGAEAAPAPPALALAATATEPIDDLPEPTASGGENDGDDDGAAAALAALDDLLRSRRLWATVERDATTAVVRSAACDDPAMRAALDELAGELAGAGFGELRCIARHGATIFETALP